MGKNLVKMTTFINNLRLHFVGADITWQHENVVMYKFKFVILF